MAATSSTRRRGRPRTANRRNSTAKSAADLVNVALPRPVANLMETASRATRNAFNAFRIYLLESATSEIESVMPNRRRRASTQTPDTPSAPQQMRRARGRAQTARAARRNTGSALNLANLGRGNTLADQVYRNLPAIGNTTTLANLGIGCTLPNGRRPRAQDIGAVANRFKKAGIVSRGTGPNRNQVTTMRREALAA